MGTVILAKQGHPTAINKICQDNKSGTSLEKNRKASSGKQMRTIDIQHVMVANQMEKGNLEILCLPTDKMKGDYFVKTSISEFQKTVVGQN